MGRRGEEYSAESGARGARMEGGGMACLCARARLGFDCPAPFASVAPLVTRFYTLEIIIASLRTGGPGPSTYS